MRTRWLLTCVRLTITQLPGFTGPVGAGVVPGVVVVGVGVVPLIGPVPRVPMFLWFALIVSVISLLKSGLLLWVTNALMSTGTPMFVTILQRLPLMITWSVVPNGSFFYALMRNSMFPAALSPVNRVPHPLTSALVPLFGMKLT